VLYFVKWLIGISCLGRRTLNIHQTLLNGVCRHITTSGDLPFLFSHSPKQALMENNSMGRRVKQLTAEQKLISNTLKHQDMRNAKARVYANCPGKRKH